MKKILITGASKGIGKATALKLLNENYKVVGLSRTHSIKDKNYTPIKQDLNTIDQVAKCMDSILKENRSIEAFISVAGEGIFENLENFSDKTIKDYFNLNLLSHLIISKKLVSFFKKKKKGYFIFIGSEAALNGGEKGTLYTTAKHGLFGFVKSLKLECNRNNIRVTIINSGMVRTKFFKNLKFKPGKRKENAISVNDIASLISYLLSTSKYINISEINISPLKKVIDFKKK
ncbi:MAG: hypothetical protein CMP24_03615 [Rickettsiales bacterium]|nr:hypothetical protein [Rickettsiales bacterium]|tara:strand:+ start:217 stop:912 length:696 start_codon:yes stop_codon:yes gene_type:complete